MTCTATLGERRLADGAGLSASRPVPYAPRMTETAAAETVAAQPVADSALMLRYAAGDTRAFETLYRRHNAALYRYLLRQCREPAAAEDVFQEVWGRIVNARDGYRPSAKFTTWLYTIARNCFIDHLRRNLRHADADGGDPDLQAAASPGPDDDAERGLLRRRMFAALDALPDEQREAFLLHHEAGLNVREIAEVTASDREAAKSRLRYATRKLHAALTADGSPADGARRDRRAGESYR